jgi:type VI secretion system protein ImpA
VDDTLLQPITVDAPCGESLEDKQPLVSLDQLRLFGASTALDDRPDPRDPDNKRLPPPDWKEIRKLALEGLRKSKDLRVLAYFGTASLRTDGLPMFAETLSAASQWLETYWTETYPRVEEEDAISRRSALNCLADPMAVIDGLRKATLVASRQHGTFGLRHVDMAAGKVTPSGAEVRPSEAQINAAFAEAPIENLLGLRQNITTALAAVKAISAKMSANAGPESAPEFDPLSAVLGRLGRVLDTQLGLRTGRPAGEEPEPSSAADSGTMAVGSIRSRQDAMRALDAVAEFFRRNEPSSPVPLFCDRAKRLVSKNFLEVLADVAPDAVPQARSAGGLTQGQ